MQVSIPTQERTYPTSYQLPTQEMFKKFTLSSSLTRLQWFYNVYMRRLQKISRSDMVWIDYHFLHKVPDSNTMSIIKLGEPLYSLFMLQVYSTRSEFLPLRNCIVKCELS